MLGNVIMFELNEVKEPSVEPSDEPSDELCNTFEMDAIVKAKYCELFS